MRECSGSDGQYGDYKNEVERNEQRVRYGCDLSTRYYGVDEGDQGFEGFQPQRCIEPDRAATNICHLVSHHRNDTMGVWCDAPTTVCVG